jgi:integrase
LTRRRWRVSPRLGHRSRIIAARDWGNAHAEATKIQAEWLTESPRVSVQALSSQAGRTVNDLCNAFGAQRARRDVLRMFQDAAVATGVSPTPSGALRFHDLRTTAHAWLTERSRGHLVAVSVALGHRLPGRAETYNRLAADPVLLRAALFPETVPARPLAVIR